MTNDELNRKVATLRGWKPINLGAAGWHWETPHGGIRALPNYCTDPAAWGGLLIELAAEGREARIGVSLLGKWSAVVSMHPAIADSPGRALALAFVASQEGRG